MRAGFRLVSLISSYKDTDIELGSGRRGVTSPLGSNRSLITGSLSMRIQDTGIPGTLTSDLKIKQVKQTVWQCTLENPDIPRWSGRINDY